MSYAKGDKVLFNGRGAVVRWIGTDKFTGRQRLGLSIGGQSQFTFVSEHQVTAVAAQPAKPKFIRLADMTPEQLAERERLIGLLSPRVLAREMIREDAGDEAADTWYENSFEADLANSEAAAERAANIP
jgi:hypothetical protein